MVFLAIWGHLVEAFSIFLRGGLKAKTLTAIVNGHRQSRISELLPRNYTKTV